MGNNQGKPVVFTDEGPYIPQTSLVAFASEFPKYLSRPLLLVGLFDCVLTFAFAHSQPQSFPAVTSGGKGRLWEGSHSGEERYRIDLRLEVHPQR
jgi:hypothetical protein